MPFGVLSAHECLLCKSVVKGTRLSIGFILYFRLKGVLRQTILEAEHAGAERILLKRGRKVYNIFSIFQR